MEEITNKVLEQCIHSLSILTPENMSHDIHDLLQIPMVKIVILGLIILLSILFNRYMTGACVGAAFLYLITVSNSKAVLIKVQEMINKRDHKDIALMEEAADQLVFESKKEVGDEKKRGTAFFSVEEQSKSLNCMGDSIVTEKMIKELPELDITTKI